jgi:hypothetical protein
MLTKLNLLNAGRGLALAALLCGGAVLTAQNISPVSAQTEGAMLQTVSVPADAVVASADELAASEAAAVFVRSLSSGDAQAMWMFASEEDQEAFATEDAVLEAFADAFPVLTQVESVAVAAVTQEGDTPFVQLSLTDANGAAYQADVGMWLDDAGDWKVISCDVVPLTDQVASL